MYPANEPEVKKEKEAPNPISLSSIFGGKVKARTGEPSCFIMQWNSSTRQTFDRGNKPKLGNKYVLKCVGFNGVEARFVIEHI